MENSHHGSGSRTELGEKDYYEIYTAADRAAKVQDGADQRVVCYVLVGLVVIAVLFAEPLGLAK